MAGKKKRIKPKYIVTHEFVPRPGWQKDYKEGIDLFLRMLVSNDKPHSVQNAK